MVINAEIAKSKKCNSEYSLYLTFEYNNDVIQVIREFPSKFWDRDSKIWEVPFNKLAELLKKCSWCQFNITGQYVSLEKPKVDAPKDFHFKTEPFSHQIDGFNYGLQNDRWLLADEMGLGKTKQVIDIAVAKKFQKGYSHCLIICGVNGLKWNWKKEVGIHSDEDAWILGQRISRGKMSIGSNKDKLDDLKWLENESTTIAQHYFIITNVESLRNEDIADRIKGLCDKGIIGMVAMDECHKCKDPTSQQGKGLLKIQAETMVAMTGTPLMNNPQDLYIILKWLGYEKHAFYSFKKHYCEYGGFGGYQIIGYKNMDELRERMTDIMLRRKKEEVLDLPEKTYIDEIVEMTSKQKQIYDEVTADIKEHIDEIKMVQNPLAELIRMRQATGYTGILSSIIKESAKLDRMEELVDEAISNGKQVVIFSNWTQMTDVIYDRLSTKNFITSQITGQTPDNQRQSIVDAFQKGDYKVVIGTSGAMGTGITLTAGTIEIFMDEPWNAALKEQCVDRCHRIGQQENLTIYTLMCKDTIDERIHEIVYNKGQMADALIDGKINVPINDVLNYLIS